MPKNYNVPEDDMEYIINLMSNTEKAKLRKYLAAKVHEMNMLVSTIEGLSSIYRGMIKEKRQELNAIYDRIDELEDKDKARGRQELKDKKPQLERLVANIEALEKAIDVANDESLKQKRRVIVFCDILTILDQ